MVAQVWRVLAGVVHLGDVAFEADDCGHAEGSVVGGAAGKRSLHAAAGLWGLPPARLLSLLTTRTIEAGNGGNGAKRPTSVH